MEEQDLDALQRLMNEDGITGVSARELESAKKILEHARGRQERRASVMEIQQQLQAGDSAMRTGLHTTFEELRTNWLPAFKVSLQSQLTDLINQSVKSEVRRATEELKESAEAMMKQRRLAEAGLHHMGDSPVSMRRWSVEHEFEQLGNLGIPSSESLGKEPTSPEQSPTISVDTPKVSVMKPQVSDGIETFPPVGRRGSLLAAPIVRERSNSRGRNDGAEEISADEEAELRENGIYRRPSGVDAFAAEAATAAAAAMSRTEKLERMSRVSSDSHKDSIDSVIARLEQTEQQITAQLDEIMLSMNAKLSQSAAQQITATATTTSTLAHELRLMTDHVDQKVEKSQVAVIREVRQLNESLRGRLVSDISRQVNPGLVVPDPRRSAHAYSMWLYTRITAPSKPDHWYFDAAKSDSTRASTDSIYGTRSITSSPPSPHSSKIVTEVTMSGLSFNQFIQNLQLVDSVTKTINNEMVSVCGATGISADMMSTTFRAGSVIAMVSVSPPGGIDIHSTRDVMEKVMHAGFCANLAIKLKGVPGIQVCQTGPDISVNISVMLDREGASSSLRRTKSSRTRRASSSIDSALTGTVDPARAAKAYASLVCGRCEADVREEEELLRSTQAYTSWLFTKNEVADPASSSKAYTGSAAPRSAQETHDAKTYISYLYNLLQPIAEAKKNGKKQVKEATHSYVTKLYAITTSGNSPPERQSARSYLSWLIKKDVSAVREPLPAARESLELSRLGVADAYARWLCASTDFGEDVDTLNSRSYVMTLYRSSAQHDPLYTATSTYVSQLLTCAARDKTLDHVSNSYMANLFAAEARDMNSRRKVESYMASLFTLEADRQKVDTYIANLFSVESGRQNMSAYVANLFDAEARDETLHQASDSFVASLFASEAQSQKVDSFVANLFAAEARDEALHQASDSFVTNLFASEAQRQKMDAYVANLFVAEAQDEVLHKASESFVTSLFVDEAQRQNVDSYVAALFAAEERNEALHQASDSFVASLFFDEAQRQNVGSYVADLFAAEGRNETLRQASDSFITSLFAGEAQRQKVDSYVANLFVAETREETLRQASDSFVTSLFTIEAQSYKVESYVSNLFAAETRNETLCQASGSYVRNLVASERRFQAAGDYMVNLIVSDRRDESLGRAAGSYVAKLMTSEARSGVAASFVDKHLVFASQDASMADACRSYVLSLYRNSAEQKTSLDTAMTEGCHSYVMSLYRNSAEPEARVTKATNNYLRFLYQSNSGATHSARSADLSALYVESLARKAALAEASSLYAKGLIRNVARAGQAAKAAESYATYLYHEELVGHHHHYHHHATIPDAKEAQIIAVLPPPKKVPVARPETGLKSDTDTDSHSSSSSTTQTDIDSDVETP
jgi:hypothetical protein